MGKERDATLAIKGTTDGAEMDGEWLEWAQETCSASFGGCSSHGGIAILLEQGTRQSRQSQSTDRRIGWRGLIGRECGKPSRDPRLISPVPVHRAGSHPDSHAKCEQNRAHRLGQ